MNIKQEYSAVLILLLIYAVWLNCCSCLIPLQAVNASVDLGEDDAQLDKTQCSYTVTLPVTWETSQNLIFNFSNSGSQTSCDTVDCVCLSEGAVFFSTMVDNRYATALVIGSVLSLLATVYLSVAVGTQHWYEYITPEVNETTNSDPIYPMNGTRSLWWRCILVASPSHWFKTPGINQSFITEHYSG